MALTSRLIANIYAIDGTPVDKQGGVANGRKNYFPNTGNQFYTAPTGTSHAGVTCNALIFVYPTGSQASGKSYACVETIAELVTNGS